MLRILHDTKYDFIKHWKTAVIGTIAFIALGAVLLVVHAVRHHGEALNYSVEFTGGTVIQITFDKPASADIVRAATDEAGFRGAEVTSFGDVQNYLIKVPPIEGQAAATNADSIGSHIVALLKQRAPDNPAKAGRAESVSASVGSELKSKAITAILISFVVTLIYLAIRFE